ncbi:hypothetical protein SELMODRAFT_86471 [Selaginella moellendorffii]|uniref:Pentacotripeptide-repeat region of PRORP domain-containing protein n=2 Tax=Selaginella moellendorffii TaxID=88036 RepID=D8R8E1_SELML|nr:hypothetical protein SELMODRAFT_86471 [Selaginella moellendorffii]
MPEHDIPSWNALLAAYAQKGRVDEAHSLFSRMVFKDLITWSVMIFGYSQRGDGRKGVELFRTLVLEGLEPDHASFTGLLFSCSHAGQFEECFQHFKSITGDFGLAPNEDHYNIFADILSRSARLEEAEDLIKTMPFEPDEVAWKALLNACKTNSDLKRGQRAAEQAVGLEPHKSASYLLLYSIIHNARSKVCSSHQ